MKVTLPALPGPYTSTRADVHRVAAHVVARRRQAVTGRIGLRLTAGGIGTPAFGADAEVVRISGDRLVREAGGRTRVMRLDGATLDSLAAATGVDLDAPADLGGDAPPLGDRTAPLAVDAAAAGALAEWFRVGWAVLDTVIAALAEAAEPTVIQLWPEHFDAAVDVAVTPALRVNLGASPGDASVDEPYLYVGPWGPDRPGDAAFWNAPFGAVLGYGVLSTDPDPVGRGVAFMQEGLGRW